MTASLPDVRSGSDPAAVTVTRASGIGLPVAARTIMFTLAGLIYLMMAMLMAIACANVAALVLARGVGRSREIAIRLSLGASRRHLARQLLVESTALALAGCALGSLVAVWLTQALVARLTTPFQYVDYAFDVRPDLRVFVYSALATASAALFSGIVPIRHAGRIDVTEILKGSAAQGRSRQSRRTLNALVAVQFAVTFVLVQVMRSTVFGLRSIDVPTILVVCTVLMGTGLGALYFPARAASRTDPAHTLRNE